VLTFVVGEQSGIYLQPQYSFLLQNPLFDAYPQAGERRTIGTSSIRNEVVIMQHTSHHDHDDHHAHQNPHGNAALTTANEHDHDGHGGMHAGHATLMRNRFWLSLVLTIPVLIYSEPIQEWLGFMPPMFPGSEWVPLLFSTIIFIFGGLVFLGMARYELAARQPGMMTLISLAITTSYLYSTVVALFQPEEMGFFWELVTLIDVMLLGHWIEMRSVGQAQGALQELAKLLPDQAERVGINGEIETVPVNALYINDVVLIRPGTSIPADGEVLEGSAQVNESMITGESKPVHKQMDDLVIGGTVSQSGSLRVRILKTGDQTALAGIMRLVAEAQNSKSKAQTMADRAAFWLTIIAVVAGLITFVAWLLLEDLSTAVRYTVGVLVIACPHALGLAVPLVIAISTTLSARNGLLVRQRLALENARNINTVIFDKTGTLTKGEQGVVAVATTGMSQHDALRIAAAVEGDSEHPIAKAIREKAKTAGMNTAQATDFDSISGRGVVGTVEGTRYHIGGPRLLEVQGWTLPETLQAAKSQAEDAGQAVVYLATDSEIIALFAIADVVREESADAIRELHEMGVQVAMLTGDSKAVAASVAKELNIDQYFAEVLPENKADAVRSLQKEDRVVAMVGDGVNDAPALAQSNVGIAIGAGTDVAIESAGIILVRSDPRDILKIIRLSRAMYRKTIQNLVWATGYNVIAIPLAMGILAPIGFVLPPAVGAAVMSVSTVIVAINAMLMRGLDLSTES
jgi:P-type Cu2+ transporter